MLSNREVSAVIGPNRVRQFRKAQGLSQKELAEAIGVARTTIINLELGHSEPSKALMDKLREFFRVDLDVLFPRRSEP